MGLPTSSRITSFASWVFWRQNLQLQPSRAFSINLNQPSRLNGNVAKVQVIESFEGAFENLQFPAKIELHCATCIQIPSMFHGCNEVRVICPHVEKSKGFGLRDRGIKDRDNTGRMRQTFPFKMLRTNLNLTLRMQPFGTRWGHFGRRSFSLLK
ncbi:hypothetical protein Salat_1506600 [Sesamum alatum]|uniref:Uncharacterized protein n=1 Tax=Sesamum alatum TaxID=300844 RepID=A0AAE1YCA9_9LAMI|nr:hypothetical protein Salat_1506600 [Sesamum alatum]